MIQRFFCLTYLVFIIMSVILGADLTISYILDRPNQAIIIKERLSDRTIPGSFTRTRDDRALATPHIIRVRHDAAL